MLRGAFLKCDGISDFRSICRGNSSCNVISESCDVERQGCCIEVRVPTEIVKGEHEGMETIMFLMSCDGGAGRGLADDGLAADDDSLHFEY